MQEALPTGDGIPTLDGRLICPVIACGCVNVHLGAAAITVEGLSIAMCCDHGHTWVYELDYANGEVIASVTNVEAGRFGRGFGS